MSELEEFRAAKDDYLAHAPDSPLTAKQKSGFAGLVYYPEAPGLVFDVKLDTSVDFNYAYNPNCAYNAAWSCPLPPAENWLSVPIRAGEKSFPSTEASGHAH